MTKEEFGKRIYEIRRQLGLSQLDFAHHCGIPEGYIGNLELGNKNPTLDTMSKIAEAVGMTLSEFLGDEMPVAREQDQTMNRVMVQVEKIRPEAREDLAEIIKLIAKML